jgi:hypothetical protein
VQPTAPAAEDVPAGQKLQAVVAGAAAKVPAAHATQVADEVALVAAEYVPAAQLVHLVKSDPAWKVPAGQPVARAVQPVEPGADTPPLHSVHRVAPGTAEYMPAAHGTHAVAPVMPTEVPGLQLVQVAAPAPEKVPALQLRQTVDTSCAAEPEEVPAGHAVQLVAPDAEL